LIIEDLRTCCHGTGIEADLLARGEATKLERGALLETAGKAEHRSIR